MSHDLLAVVLGLLAGVLSALFGVGGGLIFVPTLIFLGKSAHVAVATSLAAMVPVILMGSWRQTRYGAVRWRDAVVVGLASVPTAKLGEVTATSLSNTALRRAFAVLLVAVAVQMAMRAVRTGTADGPDAVPDAHPPRGGS
ncbi:MAG: sulfite exporter TauE/SafE family protein [Gaiellales bacterium]